MSRFSRTTIILTFSTVVPCILLLTLSGFWAYQQDSLTRQHEAELRPVMERYFAAIQKAYSTLDTSALQTVMTSDEEHATIALISPQAGSRLYYEFTLGSLDVWDYTQDHARLFVIAHYTNTYRVDQDGKRIDSPGWTHGIIYTLTKIDGVWKVSLAESPR